jgi:heme oxygenase
MTAMTLPPPGNQSDQARCESLHARLRQATADLHRRSEDGLDLTTKLADFAGYVSLLDVLWRFHAGYERALRRAGLVSRFRGLCLCKAEWIAQDLSVLGCAPRGNPTDVAIGGKHDALGSLYVIEGSMLGGRYIGKSAARTLGVSPLSGARFFHGYGEWAASVWTEFVRDVNDVPAAGAAADRVEAASFRAFQTFIGNISR